MKNKFLRKITNKFLRKITLVRYYMMNKQYDMPSYYPERERKSKRRIIIENIWHIIRRGKIIDNYFVYGFDVKGVKESDYIGMSDFIRLRRTANKVGSIISYVCLTADKGLFDILCGYYHLSTVHTIGFYQGGVVSLKNGENLFLKEAIELHNHLFFKVVNGGQGEGACSVDYTGGKFYLQDKESSVEQILSYLDSFNTRFIMQDRLIQHEVLNNIYSQSINTLRISSVLNEGKCIILGVVFRCGAHGEVMDNWHRGGLVIGVSEDGKFGKYGYYMPGVGTKTDRHPDSGFVFEDVIVPYYQEAIDLVVKAHETVFNNIKTLGWDVAITTDGPVLIEGNAGYDGALLQIFNGGMKQKYKALLG